MLSALKSGPESTPTSLLFIVAATFVMAFQDALVKLVSVELPLWQLFVLRSMLLLPSLGVLVACTGKAGAWLPNGLLWPVLRSLCLVLMYVAFYAALPLLPLSLVAATYYTGPLFIALFAALFIGEYLGVRSLIAVTLGFAGVLIVLQPWGADFTSLTLIPIASAVLYALAAIITRSKCAGDSVAMLSMILNLTFLVVGGAVSIALEVWQGAVGSLPHYPFLFGSWVSLGAEEWAALTVLAAANLAIHLALAKAYQSGPSPIVATFDYSYLLFASFWAFLFFAEVPAASTLLGMLVIASAGGLVILRR